MLSLANQRELSSINAQQGWTSDSEQAKACGRLLQLEQISTLVVLDVDQIKHFLQQDLVTVSFTTWPKVRLPLARTPCGVPGSRMRVERWESFRS